MRYNTNLFEQAANVPTPYIEVNQRSSENKSGDKGSVIVRFDWKNHIEFMQSIGGEYNKFETLFTAHFSKYLGQKSGDFSEINRIVNESLLQVRVTLSDTLGGSNASLVLENFDYRWTYLLKIISELYKTCIFSEGIYVTIDAKGRFDSDRYYRIFAGTVNQINEIDSPTNRQINLSFNDYSRLLRYTRYAIHPAIVEQDILADMSEVTIWKNKFVGMTNTAIAKMLIPNASSREWAYNDKINLQFVERWSEHPIDNYYKSIKSKLGEAIVVNRNFMFSYPVKYSSYNTKYNKHNILRLIWGDLKPNSEKEYQVYAKVFGKFNLYTGEFKTRADILKETAGVTFFYCYIDGAGNIHYRIPRYDYIGDKYPYVLPLIDSSSGTREHPYIYVLLEEESIDESYTQNEEDIVTRLWVNLEGDFGILQRLKGVDPNLARLNIIWSSGIRRYGLRERSVSSASFEDVPSAEMFGLALFMRILLERKKMSTTMPMRAELQVDRPFYVPHKDMIYHIKNITHTYTAGNERGPGTYTTTIDCFAGRPRSHALSLIPNLFKDVTDIDHYQQIFTNAGYDISVNKITKEELKLVGVKK